MLRLDLRSDLRAPSTIKRYSPIIKTADLHLFKPSDGLEPSTPSLPLSNEEGSEGTTGKPRAGKPRKKREWFEEE
jgi:hypothetical protein